MSYEKIVRGTVVTPQASIPGGWIAIDGENRYAFLEEARKLIVQAGHAAEAARHAQKGESGVVKIGIASGLGGIAGRAVADLCRRLPAINVECKDIFSTIQNEALHKSEIDVGFLRPPVDQVRLNCELLLEEEFVVILAKSHPLAKRKFLRLKDVADEPLLIFERSFSSGLYDKVLGLYAKQGLTPHFMVTHVEPHEEQHLSPPPVVYSGSCGVSKSPSMSSMR